MGGVAETSRGEFSILYANPPASEDAVAIGVLLHGDGKLYLRIRQDLDSVIRDEDLWYFEELPRAVADLERELGPKAALDLILQASNAMTASEPQGVLVAGGFPATLHRLYAKSVPVSIRKWETHLPLYSLRSAAGRFLENAEIEPEGWVEIPDARRLAQEQFLVRIQGTSMEPHVPDGSLAVFAFEAKGSRGDRLVLVEERRSGGASAYTLKKFESVKQAYSEDSSIRTAIRLHPLNPEHEIIELDPEDDRYRVVGFFVRALDPSLVSP